MIHEPVASWWPSGAVGLAVVLAVAGVAAAVAARRTAGVRAIGWVVVAVSALVAPGAALLVGNSGDRTVAVDGSEGPSTLRCAAFAAPGDAGRPGGVAVTDACRDANGTTRAVAMVIVSAGLTAGAVGLLMGTGQLGPGARPPRDDQAETRER